MLNYSITPSQQFVLLLTRSLGFARFCNETPHGCRLEMLIPLPDHHINRHPHHNRRVQEPARHRLVRCLVLHHYSRDTSAMGSHIYLFPAQVDIPHFYSDFRGGKRGVRYVLFPNPIIISSRGDFEM
jgi:hypothetical protein